MEPSSTQDPAIVSKLRSADLSSRRSFLRRSAAAGAGALALAVGSSNAVLAHDPGGDDVDVLNFALTLEHLEYAFYRDGLDRFDSKDFRKADTLRGFSNRIKSEVRPNLVDVREHEETHVDALKATIESLDGDPVKEASYTFGVDDADDLLSLAAVLENTGVSAYDGAISRIDDADLLTTGAQIATIEARHASYLNLLNGDDPFPNAFDPTKTESEVRDEIDGFIDD